MSNKLDAMKRAQNESKQAIVNSVAKEIEGLAPSIDGTAKRLAQAGTDLGKCWQGAAYDNVRSISSTIEADLIDISKKLKSVSNTIKSTAASVYPK